jgi:hypothetical protein
MPVEPHDVENGPYDGLTVHGVRSTHARGTVRVVAWFVEGNPCPACPPGAVCKPCVPFVALGDAPSHAPFDPAHPSDDELVIEGDSKPFDRKGPWRADVYVTARRLDGLDGKLLRAQPDTTPPWTTPPPLP